MVFLVSTENRDPAIAARRLMNRAHLRDGLPEVFIGVTLLLFAGSFWTLEFVSSRWIGTTVQLFFTLAFVALTLSGVRIVPALRRRYLVHRAGYVQGSPTKLERQQKGRGLFAGVLLAVAIAVLALVVRPTLLDGWILAGNGILFGVFAAFITDNPRFWIYGLLTVAFGFGLSFAGLPAGKGLAIFYSSIGMLYLISGAVVLILFLRKPLEAEGA